MFLSVTDIRYDLPEGAIYLTKLLLYCLNGIYKFNQLKGT